MAHVWILGVQGAARVSALGPRELVVRATPRKSIVSYSQDDLIAAHYASSHLRMHIPTSCLPLRQSPHAQDDKNSMWDCLPAYWDLSIFGH